ncbi:MAG: hypothetical protein HDT24_04060 [Ruminococcus sp.]|nr:hypothetical protein [Ruminococcus sp.]
MKKAGFKKAAAVVFSLIAASAILNVPNSVSAETTDVTISVNSDKTVRKISPYIYGVNSGVDLTQVKAGSFRLGGNRMSAYNWENNMSNAGSDYKNLSDMYLVQNAAQEFRTVPGGAALDASKSAADNNVPYTLLTLQMLGYVSSSKRGSVTENNAAPSDYWKKVVNRKNGELSLTPDKKDDSVYMDEYLNYLFDKVGKSDSETGFKAYALDNEPSLWKGTHSMVQHGELTCSELIAKSTDLASLVKDMDSGAEVFGPSLFGYAAFDSFTNPSDWQQLKSDNNYRWFIDYYLDAMKKESDAQGRRLLDVLDLHFYTEAKGACGERSCSHYDNDDCIRARLDSTRSLYDPDYHENSWITDTGAEFFPLLPNLQQSIDTYYPETKLAFTEYNFGGGDHISGGVAQADMLGIFAEYGVYFASIWSFDPYNIYQLSAINMFTDYDGQGSSFGDTLVESLSSDRNTVSVYSAVDSDNDDGKLKIIAVNKSINDDTTIKISLTGEKKFSSAKVYSLYGDTTDIRRLDDVEKISDNEFSYTLPALSVTEFVVEKQKSGSKAIAAAAAAAVIIAAAAVAAVKIKKR